MSRGFIHIIRIFMALRKCCTNFVYFVFQFLSSSFRSFFSLFESQLVPLHFLFLSISLFFSIVSVFLFAAMRYWTQTLFDWIIYVIHHKKYIEKYFPRKNWGIQKHLVTEMLSNKEMVNFDSNIHKKILCYHFQSTKTFHDFF